MIVSTLVGSTMYSERNLKMYASSNVQSAASYRQVILLGRYSDLLHGCTWPSRTSRRPQTIDMTHHKLPQKRQPRRCRRQNQYDIDTVVNEVDHFCQIALASRTCDHIGCLLTTHDNCYAIADSISAPTSAIARRANGSGEAGFVLSFR